MSAYIDDDRFDGLYLNVAQTTRGIDPLLDTVFSFLRRKTDFFSGPPGENSGGTEAAIQKVHAVLNRHVELYRAEQKKKAPAAKKATPPPPAKKKVAEEEVIEIGTDGGFDASPAAKASTGTKKETSPSPSPPAQPKDEKDTKEVEEENDSSKKPPPVGNGGTVDGKYVWTQTLSEVNLTIPLPDNTRGRDLNVTMSKKLLKVGLKSKPGEWIVNGPLVKPIVSDESFWTVEDGNRLAFVLQKINQMEWWDSVVEGDPKIDIKTISPESSNLSDLEGETRQTVEKMMFDQRQKAMGLPTSEEANKMEMFEKFKKAHPEMDFSKAKFN